MSDPFDKNLFTKKDIFTDEEDLSGLDGVNSNRGEDEFCLEFGPAMIEGQLVLAIRASGGHQDEEGRITGFLGLHNLEKFMNSVGSAAEEVIEIKNRMAN